MKTKRCIDPSQSRKKINYIGNKMLAIYLPLILLNNMISDYFIWLWDCKIFNYILLWDNRKKIHYFIYFIWFLVCLINNKKTVICANYMNLFIINTIYH